VIGASFTEQLTGGYALGSDPRQSPLSLRIHGRTSVLGFARGVPLRVDGVVDAAGLATSAPVAGTVALARPLAVRYELRFSANDGRALRLLGYKRHILADPYAGLTTLRAALYEDERRVGLATLRFDARGGLFDGLRSLELHWSG
jgi:hypothetical protein